MEKTQKQLQSEETRQRIVSAATQLFVQKGFFGTSISDLASAAGLTKGALYHHFENKDALFFAVIESVRQTWNNTIVRDVLTSKNSITRLTTLVENHTRLLRENEHMCLLLNGLVMEMDGVNPDFMSALQEVYSDLIGFIESIIKKGQEAGEIRSDLDARMLAINIVSMLRGIGCSPIFRHMGIDNVAQTENLNQILLVGLKP